MDNPSFEWNTIKDSHVLLLTFRGRFTSYDCFNAVEKYNAIFEQENETKIEMVWDCLAMKGYDSMARSHWQETMIKFKKRTGTIWLISNSSIIKTGAKVISKFTAFNIKHASSFEDLENQLNKHSQ